MLGWKRGILITAAVIIPCLIISACIFAAENTFIYTNLVDTADRDLARSLLDYAGIAREDSDLLFELIGEFYRVPYEGISAGGFEKGCMLFSPYSEKDAARHLDMQPEGSLTCRMAAFIPLRNKIRFSDDAGRAEDLDEKDPKSREKLTDSRDLLHYDLLFGNVKQVVCSSEELSTAMTEYWEAAGITFPEEANANIVTAYGSDGEKIQNFHTAVLIRSGEEVWLLEKYDPIYPYRLSRLSGEKQMIDYMKIRLSEVKYGAVFLGGDCLWRK